MTALFSCVLKHPWQTGAERRGSVESVLAGGARRRILAILAVLVDAGRAVILVIDLDIG